MQVVLLSLSLLISIFMSHKIAGPLYKLRKAIAEARAGNLDLRIQFRQKDYFQELAPEFNTLMDSIQDRIAQKEQGISDALPEIQSAISQASPEVRAHLENALAILRNIQRS